ncbi:MAG TPA: Rieske 2Fe-2S domain-containing protein [Candidatus Binatia bacterium]
MRKAKKACRADLAKVGSGTPARQWFRRYWMVAGTTRDLCDIPQTVRILGEDVVLFRDSNGKIGLVGQSCPHRGTSLEYGDIEDGGIRCPYHGWLFNIHGQCLNMPGEPKNSEFAAKVKHLAYPVKGLGGLIFAYMGPLPEGEGNVSR